MQAVKEWAMALLILIGVPLVFIGLFAFTSDSSTSPESDSAADAYEAQLEAESRQEDALIRQEQAEREAEPRCVDVTSYDYNWENDMLCTRPDGSKFYTNYEDAERYLSQ